MIQLPGAGPWALVFLSSLGLMVGSCRTTTPSPSDDDSTVKGDIGEMLTEEQWIALCQKALQEEEASRKKDPHAELHEISQTTDCQKAYPAVKKIYNDAYKVIVTK